MKTDREIITDELMNNKLYMKLFAEYINLSSDITSHLELAMVVMDKILNEYLSGKVTDQNRFMIPMYGCIILDNIVSNSLMEIKRSKK